MSGETELRRCIIVTIFMIQGTMSKPYLGNFLLQAASSLSFAPPDDPQSHVSDFRTQPKANSRMDIVEGDKQINVDMMESSITTTEMPQNREPSLLPEWINNNGTNMYYGKIGGIIRSARERISMGFQRLSARLRNSSERFNDFLTTGAFRYMNIKGIRSTTETSAEIDFKPLNNMNTSETDLKTMSTAVDDPLQPIYQLERRENEQRNNAAYQLAFLINNPKQTIDPLQLFNNNTSGKNHPTTLTIPKKNFLAGRFQNITKHLNETRNLFRNRTIKAIATLVPLVVLATKRKGYGTGNTMETGHTNEFLTNLGMETNDNVSQLSSKLSDSHSNSDRNAPTDEGKLFSNSSEPNRDHSNNQDEARKNYDDDYQKKDNFVGSSRIDVEDVFDPSHASYSSAAKKMNLQSMGMIAIIVLEVFGSIFGLTWGALNHLRLLFQ
ncbi:uncharacterized protein LOC129777316 [Toxorhynchites rutilus septentrionalis]|uniref:uncharacterized protein LOC129777316 n=1 Tax=Toxorhynchites rutilus septentrionalis TaxID=329112 RepID=UPI002479BA60|nr:uncharacterized protein LOC129777316 [Toxorhynchites rutilus septentrionalis]